MTKIFLRAQIFCLLLGVLLTSTAVTKGIGQTILATETTGSPTTVTSAPTITLTPASASATSTTPASTTPASATPASTSAATITASALPVSATPPSASPTNTGNEVLLAQEFTLASLGMRDIEL